ncbi:MAG: GGDEF domain-containing protein [Burkholderiales bacterium]|jgi:diguanylate cyclase (GGDEF)-like protein|nr:GGDEF domain-containing protein [Burkholderiales bacterium]
MKSLHPHRHVDVDALRLGSALMLIAQSGQPVCADAQAPQDYVQSVIDALCDLSSRDPLTGLSNRRAFCHVMEQELDRVARLGDDALLLMVDVDHFKPVNDVHGHLAGDKVLQQMAQRLLTCIRPMDSVARFGGEEFAVVLPNCSHSYSTVVAERIRQAVEAQPFELGDGKTLSLTVSVGGAFAPQWVRSGVSLWVERADRQLYRAKKEGRNRVCLEETFDTVVSTEEKELLYGALNLTGLANGHATDPEHHTSVGQS